MTNAPILCMTFDDHFVEEWFSALPLFRRYNVKATFFICWPHRLDQRKKRLLRKLQAEGHEIGCHTYTHCRLPKFLQSQTVEDYLSQEIDPAIAALRDLGFEPRCFSYPYFKHRDYVTEELLKRFDVVRTDGPRRDDEEKQLTAQNGCRVVETFCMTDKTGMELPISYYRDKFAHLKAHGGAGVSCGHSLGDRRPKYPKMRCSMEDLEIILALAEAHGFVFKPLSALAT